METQAMAAAMIIGIINGIKLFQTDKVGFMYFLCAVILGVIFGVLKLMGIPLEEWVAIALSSSGVYKLGQIIGERT